MLQNVKAVEAATVPFHFISEDGSQFFARVEKHLDSADLDCVRIAFEVAKRQHGDARRASGELFFTHPLTVAYYLAEYSLDAPALMASLLHDVAEDTKITIPEIRKQFGADVSRLVDGVTKLKNVGRGQVGDASLHKLLRYTARDVRVVIIKIFDRLHNMRTIRHLPLAKQRKKARETLAVYAPIANRLGMWQIKNELEARSLQVLNSRAYAHISSKLDTMQAEHQHEIPATTRKIKEKLRLAGVPVVKVEYYPRQVYSVYRDLQMTEGGFDDIDNTMRMIVVVEEELDCYTALGCMHQLWPPVAQKFDDYISVPRDNLYRSLHTTVVHDSGKHLKLRVRTAPMDNISEIGVLARWYYRNTTAWGMKVSDRVDAFLANLQEEVEREPDNVDYTIRGVLDNLLGDQIRVYTPRGEMKELRKGATPIDFAYTIHTEIGNQCQGANINGVQVPLNHVLQDGDQVHIDTQSAAQPQRIWLDEDLNYLVTNRAKSKIRRWFRRLPLKEVLAQGQKLLLEELAMLGYPTYPHRDLAATFEYENEQDLYFALGMATILPTELATRIAELTWHSWPSKNVGNIVHAENGESYVITHAEGRELSLCPLCRPEPGDRIIGVLHDADFVTVHRASCIRLAEQQSENDRLKLSWGEQSPAQARIVSIKIELHDRVGILHEITELLLQKKININYFDMPRQDREKQLFFDLELMSPRDLVRVLHRIAALLNVFSVRCTPGVLVAIPHTAPANKTDIYLPPE